MADAGSTLASAPIGQLIRDMAMAIADAQEQLDAAAIRTARKMADTSVRLGGDAEELNLLELGFAPTFYSFIEADIELVLETRISEDTSIGASVGAELGGTTTSETPGSPAGETPSGDAAPALPDETPADGEAAGQDIALASGTTPAAGGAPGTPARGPSTSTRSVGMTMSAEFQRKFAVETSGHTRITAKLVALPPPARFLEAIRGDA